MSSETGVVVAVAAEALPEADVSNATRDAVQPDQHSRLRQVLLMDQVPRQQASMPLLRGGEMDGGPVQGDDNADVTSPTLGLLSSRMAVGAGRELVLDVWHQVADGAVLVTPLLFDVQGIHPQAVLASQYATAATPMATADGWYIASRLVWPLQGAAVVGVHLSQLGGVGNAVLVWGGALPQETATFPGALGMRYVPLVNLNQGLSTPDWAQP